jgi:small-conductance mechanosensitive channel/CRP-like cAMP-binding protein
VHRPTVPTFSLGSLVLPTALFVVWLGFGIFVPDFGSTGEGAGAVLWLRRGHRATLWLIGAVVLHRWICVVALDGFAARAAGKPIQKIFKDVLAMVILAIAGMGILVTVFGQSMSSFWAASGVLGIVLGIALRPIILDFFSGLGANLDRAYSIGDWIVVLGNSEPIRGWIEEINWRTLRLRTRDGYVVMVPNSRLATSAVINHSLLRPESRFQLRLRLDAEVAVDRALRILSAAANAAAARPDGPCREPIPDVLVADASAMGIEYVVRFWLDPSRTSPDTVSHVVWTCVLDHMGKAGLTFAHPQENVYFARMPRIAQGFKHPEDRLAFLRRVALFQNFPDSSLQILAEEVRIRSLRPGQWLVRGGDAGDSMFLVAEGTLRVFRSEAEGGSMVELATLQPGDLAGERSLLTGEPRSASVAALTECIVLEITRESLTQVLNREPGLLPLLEKTVAERERLNQSRTDLEASEAASSSARGRPQHFITRMREFVLGRTRGDST